ncbi:MAG: hypothetical protein QNK22_04960 [Xanthomonadales bacterium]|nr:hypothetical protein [Xanthomonadales bacterium]
MASKFSIQGRVKVSDQAALEAVGTLKAIAIDRNGQVVGSALLGEDGQFSIDTRLSERIDVLILIGPEMPDEELRKTARVRHSFSAEKWKSNRNRFVLKPTIVLSPRILELFRPKTICVSGHIRKIPFCPVPFVKVEIFDVDRGPCWWDLLRVRIPELLDRQVLRVPDLTSPRPFPPIPLPDPVGRLPLPPRPGPDPVPLRPPSDMWPSNTRLPVTRVPFSRLPNDRLTADPDDPQFAVDPGRSTHPEIIGEIKNLEPAVAEGLSQLTLTSTLAPWTFFQRCFYSRRKVCQTVTDEDGFFNCCFKWYPLTFRQGRLRYDYRPDIIIRVTQIVDGVEKVIYMDPYTSTRWNSNSTHIDLWLDDEDVQCGDGDPQNRPEGTQAFFTRIGHNDEVYKINQSNGMYQWGGYTNAAYGSLLRIFAQFGTALSLGAHYYRLSYAKTSGGGSTFLNAILKDTRVHRLTNFSETHMLGPHTVGGEPSLYEIRDFQTYLWYHADLIGLWGTAFETDQGTYRLRLEVFDNSGNKLGAGAVNYLDGTVAPPAVLPSTGFDWADLVTHLDNKAPTAELNVHNLVDPACGVIKWTPGMTLQIDVDIVQENGRLHDWGLWWQKGVTGGSGQIKNSGGPASTNGSPFAIHGTFPGIDDASNNNLTSGLTSTCAFAFHVWAYSHVRNGDKWLSSILRGNDDVAIAVEKCS